MKKLLLSLTLFSFFFFSNTNSIRASHLLGGEITWQCLTSGTNTGKMIFTIKLYCACYSGAAICPTSSVIISNPLYSLYGGVSSITCVNTSVTDLAIPCYDPSQQMPCGLPISMGGNRAIKEYVFVSAPVQINGIPDSAGSDFTWASCCRPVVLNLAGGSYWIRATMFPYTDPTTNTISSFGSPAIGPSCYDNSPAFAASIVPVSCAGSNTSLPLGCYDDDYDSLTYSWSLPMQTAANPIIWKPNYSTTSQFPNTLHHPSNVPATLDSTTGLINFNNMVLNGSGYHQYCVKVSSFRKGQKIAEVFRDVPHIIFNCPPSSFSNTLPVIELKDAGKNNYKTMLDTAIQVGSYIELDLRSTDVDTLPTTNPTNLQSVDIEVDGFAMSKSPNNPLNCIYKPCAYLDTTGNLSWNTSQQRFVDSAQVNVKFKWQTDCGLLFPVSLYNGQPHSKEFTFTIRSNDNYCPQPGESSLRFKITVYDSTTIPKPFVEIDAFSGGAKLKWSQYTNADFQSYNLFRSFDNTGPWTLIHTATMSNSVTYHDQIARTDTFAHYYKLRVNNSLCSETGYEARSIFLEGKLEPNGMVNLNWNKPQDDPGVAGQYSVFRRYDIGGWTRIGTKPYNLNYYQDFDPFVSRYNYYKIEITDTKGLRSVSNVYELERDTPVVIIPGIVDEKLDNIQLLPNPFKNELILIDEANKLLGETIIFYNVLGDRVYEHKVQAPKTELDLSKLKPGVYFVHYKDIRGNVESRRLVKME